MLRLIAFLFVVCMASISFKENPSVSYISQYKEIAISEMLRSGVPASIKMAQALLESGAGQSTLARKANNHFGIKCGGGWSGEEFYREDDDYVNGKLIKSCFRKFDNVAESYIAHSDFLKTQSRYAFLFNYPIGDYKSWAHGLKKAGYATDRKYPKKLIEIIEKYQLYKLDNIEDADMYYADNGIFASGNEDTWISDSQPGKADRQEADKQYFLYPGATVADDTEFSRKGKKEDYKHRYTQKKSGKTYHIVRRGETIADIADYYDIDERELRMRNRIPKDAEPLSGEKLHLKESISLTKRPEFIRYDSETELAAQDEFIF